MRKEKITINKGEIFWFDPLKETKINVSPLAIILSSATYNQFADHLIIGLVSKSAEKIKENIEIKCQVAEKELKILATWIYTVNKKKFSERAIFLGKVNQQTTTETLNDKLKLILELDS